MTTPPDVVTQPGVPPASDRFEVVDKYLKRERYAQDQLIEALHVAQDVFGYLADDLLVHVARELRLPPSMVYGVATFYQLFTFDPPGEHTCTVCTGTACFVKGADRIVADLSERHGVAAGATSDDGQLTLRTARCLGSCGLAPVVVVDGEVLGHQDPDAARRRIDEALASPVPASASVGGR